VAAGNDGEAAVAARETIGIIQNLDIPFVPFREVDGVLMEPMIRCSGSQVFRYSGPAKTDRLLSEPEHPNT
jgi:hypothetical protein